MRIDLRKFLTQEEKIGGIEFSDSKISIAYLRSLPDKKEITIEKWGEINLQPGIIEKGEVKNKEILASHLRNLLNSLFPQKKRHFGKIRPQSQRFFPVIISIPSQKIYAQVFSFPSRIPYEQLEESMELTMGFSLPLPPEKVYLDWEVIEPLQKEEEKEILLAQVKKSVIDPYLEVFSKTDFVPIGGEFYSASLNRIISNIEEKPFYLVLTTAEGVEIAISKLKGIRFIRSLYWQDHRYFREKNQLDMEVKKKILRDETWRTINFDQSENKGYPIEKIYLIGDPAENLEFKECLKEDFDKEIIIPEIPYIMTTVPKKIAEEDLDGVKEIVQIGDQKGKVFRGDRALVVLGAALRGFIPRSKDISISLLPVGTEEEYSEAKLISFLNFVNISVIIAALIFIPLFVGSYFLMSTVKSNIEKELAHLQQVSVTEEFKQMEKDSTDFNNSLNLMETLAADKSDWSILLKELSSKKTAGIIYNQISVGTYKGAISLGGMALTRDQLLNFKQSLMGSEILTNVDLPLQYLEIKDNINFIITFKIKS